MRLKFAKNILEAQDNEYPIADICWSPNNIKLAVATCERVVYLFDREGVRRDKFNTKPADPAAGKKSYVITSLSFSENCELLGIAQSDAMVFVYRVGTDWNGKKVICNKFPLSGIPTKLLPAENGFFVGTTDGKIRSLDCKTNKSSSLWTSGSCCVSLARGSSRDGVPPLASGHLDGTLYVNGRLLLRYALPPTALALVLPYLIVGSCEGRVAVYDAQRGTLLRSVEPQLAPERKDLICATPSPSGQIIAFGVFDGCILAELKDSGSLELDTLNIPNLYAARALAWSGDGTKLAVASQTGAVLMLEAVLRRWVWRDTIEVQHVTPKQLVLTRLAKDTVPLTVATKLAPDIYNVKFIGNDWYAVCRTSASLILCDIARSLTSEIQWSGSGERIYAAVGGACLIHRAGELCVIEYGLDKILHTVRTERVNPHVISVRINEGRAANDTRDNKKLAYLLDKQTIAVVDLVSGVQLGQWWHEARVDWLELNEGGQLLLFRDTRRRLALLRLQQGVKEIIASGVSFVQWIENSDAVVAQTPTHMLVWYSVWETDSVEMSECPIVDTKEKDGLTSLVALDEHRLAFNNALRNGDLEGCAQYLNKAEGNSDLSQLWRKLADRALLDNNVQLAAKCYKEVGDDARMFYLEQTVALALQEGSGNISIGLESPLVKAKLAIFSGDLSTAEDYYVKKADNPQLGIEMYKMYNKWTEAIALAEKVDRGSVLLLKQQRMDYLTSTGRLGAAGSTLAADGDTKGAVRLWLRGGRARRAANLLLQNPALFRDTDLVDSVQMQLIKEEWWEMAGEISEKRGDIVAAVKYFAKGNNYARAVQLAREACPGEVTQLERSWGEYLVSSRQAGAAVQHLIEAGDTRSALTAALKAHHFKKALQIVQVIEDKESISEQCEQLGEHFISTQDWETAERVFCESGMADRCVRAYNEAGHYADAIRLAVKHLSENDTRDIFMPLAQQLRLDGNLKKAEQIYIGLGEYDEAISMYKEVSQYEAMLRLVAAHRGSLLEPTRKHIAQAYLAAGDLRNAEQYFIQAGDWKSAIQMYRSVGSWESAMRVASAHAPTQVQQQVALLWAGSLGGGAGARLLAARGLAATGAKWALQAHRWDIAMELSDLGGGITKREVARHEAASLAEDSPDEAEAAFLRASAPEDAVRMWLEKGVYDRAITLAEQHAPHLVEEASAEGAKAAADRGDLAQFEALMIRANRPREVVQHYKELELWEEASRVAREYLPDSAEPVPPSVPPLLQRAAEHADREEWWEAIELLCAASAAGADGGAGRLAERAALRAARLARDHLLPRDRARAADLLRQRFFAIGQNDVADQLKAALTEGYVDAEEHQVSASPPEEYMEETVSHETKDSEVELLERLARTGQWQRVLAHAGPHAPHYALRYAAYTFRTHPRTENIDPSSDEVPESVSIVLEALRSGLHTGSPSDSRVSSNDAPLARTVCAELIARVSLAPKAVMALKDACEVLLAAGAEDRMIQACSMLVALHAPCVSGRVARALPRYSDIIVADVAFYIAGMKVREEGPSSAQEAFVLLNRCLDLAEAADEQAPHLLDYTDFECCDWSTSPLLLDRACVPEAALHDVKEWVLALSMDQSVEQTLPLDSRDMYAASLSSGEPCCVLTGYPLSSRLVTFTNGRCANREWWARLTTAAKSGGPSAYLLEFITLWCGPADYRPL